MIKDSIEMKLDEIQKKKANLANLSLKPMTRKELMEQKVSQLQGTGNVCRTKLTCLGGRTGKSLQVICSRAVHRQSGCFVRCQVLYIDYYAIQFPIGHVRYP